MKEKIRKILEYTWLTIAILSFFAGLHRTYKAGIKESFPFFIMTFVSVLMYMFRRNQRLLNK